MTRPDLDALAALLDKATPGPWRVWDHYPSHICTDHRGCTVSVAQVSLNTYHDESRHNRDLIVAAVNALPALIAYARALERERDPVCDGDKESCPVCGTTQVHDGCCIRHGDVDTLWSAHDIGSRAAALAMREKCAQACNPRICGSQGFAGPSCCVLPHGHAGDHRYGEPRDMSATDCVAAIRGIEP